MRSCRLRGWVVSVVVALSFGATSPNQLRAGDDPEGKEIGDIVVTGNSRHTSKQILDVLRTKVGKPYDPATIYDDVRRLYNTRWFLTAGIRFNTQMESDGRVTLLVSVNERISTVKEIAYEGADHLSESELHALTGLSMGDPMDPYANEFGRRAILMRYQEDGRDLASVELIEGGKPSDTRVVYRIVEGPVAKIGTVEFVGNENAPAHRLRVQVTHEGKFIPANLVRDQQALKDYYRKFGFEGVQVTSEVRRLGDTGQVTIVYHIVEGNRK
jgi:outer membrane protein assembly factor BamA